MRTHLYSRLFSLSPATAVAADPTGVEFFEKKVRPVLSSTASSATRPRRKSSRAGCCSIAGPRPSRAATGAGARAGDPAKSRLIEGDPTRTMSICRCRRRASLPDAVIADLTAWVKMGCLAERSRRCEAGPTRSIRPAKRKREHWAWQPMQARRRRPCMTWLGRGRRSIASLPRAGRQGLKPARDADRGTLLRRRHFDLIGLPPTPERGRGLSVPTRRPDAFGKVVGSLCVAAVRRALGPALARPGSLRREPRPRVRLHHSQRLPVSRLRHPRLNADVPYNQFVDRAHRRRPAAR